MPPVTFSATHQQEKTTQPSINVLIDQAQPGKTYEFELVVIDDLGNESQPVKASVEIRGLPVAKLTIEPPVVKVGQPFTLNAKASTSGERIVEYRWRLLTPRG